VDYKEALKQIQASKKETKNTYLLVHFGYDRRFVFPYKEGLAFLAALESAEQIHEEYNKPPNIGEIYSSINIEPMNHTEYMAYKIANLLQIDLSDARRMQQSGGNS